MMSQGPPPPGAGYRNPPFDGNLKGGQAQQVGHPGSFPQSQMPSSNMTNGQMNGVYDRLPSSQFPQQPSPQKGHPMQPPTSQFPQGMPQQPQRPGMPPQQPPSSQSQQMQRPGMPPQQPPSSQSQQMQRPGMPPQQPPSSQSQQMQRPGMPPQQPPSSQSQQMQRPGMPPQQPPSSQSQQMQRPGMPPQQSPASQFQQIQRPGMPPQQQPPTSQFQQQQQPGMPPQQRPGMPPQQPPTSQQQQQPGMPPQQPPTSQQQQQPGMPPQQQPGMPPQQRPGMPLQQPPTSQQQQQPGMPPQQQPGMPPQQRPGMPPQQPPTSQQQQQPGMPPTSQQQRHPGMPPQPPTSQQQQPGMPPPTSQYQQTRPFPQQPSTLMTQQNQMNQQMQNISINPSSHPSQQPQPQMGWPQPGQQAGRPPMPRQSSPSGMPSYPQMPTSSSGAGGPTTGLSMSTATSLSGPMMPGGQPMMPPSSFPGPQPGGYPGTGPTMSHPGQRPMGGMPGPGAMQSPMQQQKRIDPDQMPSPIQVMKDDQQTHKDGPFLTNTRGRIPPLVTSKFSVKDDGNCSPRFMRSTMYNVPCNKDLLQASDIPFALTITPFAQLPPNEGYLPVISHGSTGPVRCNRCKAYINPFVQFIDGGRRFVCNICTYSTEVPADYFCHLDHQGLRVDIYERPELHLGSYEFVATTDYCKDQKLPEPPAYIFMIDVSYQSVQCGMVRMLMKELGELLDHLPREFDDEQTRVKVGFVTYSNHLHFYNVKESLAQPQMMVVSDVEDVFVPLLDGFLVSVQEARSVIDSLLEQIINMFADTRETETVLGPVIQAGVEALKSAGISGKLFIFQSSLPIAEAPGKLKNREDRKLLGSDKEKTILGPQSTFYEKLAKDCVEAGVTVDMFLFPNAYVDLATIGSTATMTGGQIFRYSYFKENTHGEQFREDLKRSIECNMGFDAVMRVRCSTGLRPVEFHGNFFMSNTTDIELAGIDPFKSMCVEIKHDDKLQEDSTAYIQCALLYTSVSGQRRLRIHNLACNTCTQLSELFRCCEMDTFVNYVSKQAISQVLTLPPKDIREKLVNQCAQILACYRRNCASPSSAGQLILPECMKLLPLYVNCVLKNDALSGGSEMSTDDRNWLMRKVLSMDQNVSVPYFYPRLFPVHDTDPQATSMPIQIRSSAERMSDNGIYVLDNGIALFLWVGLQVDPSLLQQVFGVTTIGQVDIEMTSLPEVDSPMSVRIRNIVAEIRSERQHYLKLTIVRQRDKLEPWFKHFLVEDKGMNPTQQSYVDFLCLMHKEIRTLLN